MCGRFNLVGLSWRKLHDLMVGIAPEESDARWSDDPLAEIPLFYSLAPTRQVPMQRLEGAN